MRHKRILVRPGEIFPEEFRFSSQNAHYLRDVLRLKPGDRLCAFDGGREYAVKLVRCSKEEVIGRLEDSLDSVEEDCFEMTLAFCCVRPGPMEEILRHGTEIGVCRFVPILSRRSSRRPTDKKQRWEAVIASAAAQSGRVGLPVVESPQSFDNFIEQGPPGGTRVLLTASRGIVTLLALLEEREPGRITLLVGPEGGFEPSEVLKAVQAGFCEANLGSGVLRTETAGIIAAGIASMWYHWKSGVMLSAANGSSPAGTPAP